MVRVRKAFTRNQRRPCNRNKIFLKLNSSKFGETRYSYPVPGNPLYLVLQEGRLPSNPTYRVLGVPGNPSYRVLVGWGTP